jgi:glucose-1-phosphate thymidylyltransferase
MTVRTAVVLAAGEGTRLRPLTRNRPKHMLPAANRPILEHVLDALVDAGIDRIAVVVGYHRERVQEYFGPTHRDVPLEYVVQAKQLGSGHALLQARDVVDGPLVVVNGDRIIEAGSVSQIVDASESDESPAAMAYIERRNAHQYGAVTVQDRHVEEIVEKPEIDAYRLINAGIYAFDPGVFDEIEATERHAGELGLPDTITRLIERDRVRAVKVGGLWVDATFPWTCWRSPRRCSRGGASTNRRPGTASGSTTTHRSARTRSSSRRSSSARTARAAPGPSSGRTPRWGGT